MFTHTPTRLLHVSMPSASHCVPSTFFDIVPVGKNNELEVFIRWYSGRRCGADRRVFLTLLGKSTNSRDSTLLLDVAGQGCKGSDCDVEFFTVHELVQYWPLSGIQGTELRFTHH